MLVSLYALLQQHPDVRSAIRKIEEVTNVPYENYESFQVPNCYLPSVLSTYVAVLACVQCAFH